MSFIDLGPSHVTHEVFNQPPPLEGYNLFAQDRVLVEALERECGGWARNRAHDFGELVGGESFRLGAQANANPPVLRAFDRFGQRIDEVEFHPAWHELMRVSVAHGLHALSWREARAGAHVARAALFFVMNQVEAGHCCPISMTHAAVPTLRQQAEIAAEWEARLTSLEYDPRVLPVTDKRGALCGMAMTEKQGGSDVRANTTRAVPLHGQGAAATGPGREYLITGHKWFCSQPMCDAFLVLAQAARGLSCFFLPRWLPDGTRNRMHIQRLKDKLGNRSNASSEVEYDGAWARMVGEEGRGVATIIEMVNHTRLDCVIGAAAGMRQAVSQAAHHAAHRSAFGKPLIDQPLMRNVLADLCIESEAATMSMMRLARAYDDAQGDDGRRRFARLATAVIKYWLCKRQPVVVAEALECLGGAGFVEESILPRLYREAPLNGIWEGSGNVICLDVLRAIARDPVSLEIYFEEIEPALGFDGRLDAFVDRLRADLTTGIDLESRARSLVEQLALALQGALLVGHSDRLVADAFCASRLGGEHALTFGTLPARFDFGPIVDRARPRV